MPSTFFVGRRLGPNDADLCLWVIQISDFRDPQGDGGIDDFF